jgi:hypothetical protein
MEGPNMKLQLTRTIAASVFLVAQEIIPAQEPVSNASKPPRHEDKGPTTGNAPKDHLSLADYFRELASQEHALAESHEHIATLYKEKAPPVGLDPASAREMKKQYKRLAEIATKAAQAADNLAEYHSRLAELASHAPLAPRHANPTFSSLGK